MAKSFNLSVCIPSYSEEELLIAAIENEAHRKDWSATLTINEHSVAFKIDTGAQCNVILYSTYSRISRQLLMKSRNKLVAFGGQRLNTRGKVTLLCQCKQKFWPVDLTTSSEMRLLQHIEALANDVLSRYADTFNGLGCITNVTHHIQLDPNHKPVVHPPHMHAGSNVSRAIITSKSNRLRW